MPKKTDKQQQVRDNGWMDPETSWELRRLAKMWGISLAQAERRCIHYMGAICRKSQDRSITETANIHQAEAKVEMLKAL